MSVAWQVSVYDINDAGMLLAFHAACCPCLPTMLLAALANGCPCPQLLMPAGLLSTLEAACYPCKLPAPYAARYPGYKLLLSLPTLLMLLDAYTVHAT